MDESEVEKSCVKPEENQPTFIFDGGFCQIGAYMCMTGVEGRSQPQMKLGKNIKNILKKNLCNTDPHPPF